MFFLENSLKILRIIIRARKWLNSLKKFYPESTVPKEVDDHLVCEDIYNFK